MPKYFLQYLQGGNIFTCAQCQTHLSSLPSLIHISFSSFSSPILFDTVINIKVSSSKHLLVSKTGNYLIRDIFCLGCYSCRAIGWMYEQAEKKQNKYVEGWYSLYASFLDKQNWIE